jgi:hypothetical protein
VRAKIVKAFDIISRSKDYNSKEILMKKSKKERKEHITKTYECGTMKRLSKDM